MKSLLAGLRGRRRGPGGLDVRLRPPLEPEERIVAWAPTAGGTPVVATNRGLWLPAQPPRRTGWHEIHKVTWSPPRLAVTPAVDVSGVAVTAVDEDTVVAVPPANENTVVGMTTEGYRVMVDAPTVTCLLEEPGKLPEQVRTRVNRSIADTRYHVLAGGGGVRVVARRVSGVDGLLWTVRYDEGTDTGDPEVVAETGALVAAARAELAPR